MNIKQVFPFFFYLFCFGCKHKIMNGHLEEMNLKGDIILIQNEYGEYSFFDENGFIIKSYIEEKDISEISNYYYVNGRLVSKIKLSLYDNELHKSVETNYYDENQNIKYKVVKQKDRNRTIFERSNFQYLNGLLISDSVTRSVDYDDKSFYGSRSYSKYRYSNGLKMKVEREFNSFFSKEEFEQDITIEDVSEYHKSVSTFLNGLEIKNETEDGVINYEYIFDAIGNWIERRANMAGENTVSRRIIFYKGNDISYYEKNFEKVQKGILEPTPTNNEENNSPIISTDTYEEELTMNLSPIEKRRACSSCNGTGKCEKCNRVFKKPYYTGQGSYERRNETRFGLIICNDCSGYGHKQKHRDGVGWEPSIDCYITSCQDGWVNCNQCNSNGNGSNLGICKWCNGTGYRN